MKSRDPPSCLTVRSCIPSKVVLLAVEAFNSALLKRIVQRRNFRNTKEMKLWKECYGYISLRPL
jgi:hypothetical protein